MLKTLIVVGIIVVPGSLVILALYKLFKWCFRKEEEKWAKVDEEVERRIDELHK